MFVTWNSERSSEVILPSIVTINIEFLKVPAGREQEFANVWEFVEQVKPPLYEEFTIVIVEDDTNDGDTDYECFKDGFIAGPVNLFFILALFSASSLID
jgi:hypothetical protein